MKIIEPFILHTRVALPPEPSPSEEHYYDYVRQIWINSVTDMPVVTECNTQLASKFGETSITETREGADQSEISAFNTSRFGDTTMTKSSEGHDQGGSIFASRFGETSITATREGADQPKISAFNTSRFGETTITRSSEGHDRGGSIFASKFDETSVTATHEGQGEREGKLGTADAPHRHF